MDTISRTYTVVMAILLHLLFFLDIDSNPMSSELGRTAILHDVPDAEAMKMAAPAETSILFEAVSWRA